FARTTLPASRLTGTSGSRRDERTGNGSTSRQRTSKRSSAASSCDPRGCLIRLLPPASLRLPESPQQELPICLRALVTLLCAGGPIRRGHRPVLVAPAPRRLHVIKNLLRFVGVLIPRGFGRQRSFGMCATLRYSMRQRLANRRSS